MNKKRILALLMTFVMLFTTFGTVLAENTDTPAEETVITPLDTDEFKALYAMGFVGEELKQIDKTAYITRAQFTGYLFKMTGYTVTDYKTDDIPFEDVSIATLYHDEICTMYQMGIVNGTDPNKFSPDAHVTYAQACKLITDVLGYRTYTEVAHGEFPQGHISMAAELDLDEGVKNVKWNAELTAEDAVTMLYNAGLAEVMAFSGTNGYGNPTYSTDGTILLEKSDIYYAQGTMQSNGICSVTAENPEYGTTIIDGQKFISSDYDLSKLLGAKVKYFYRDTEVEKKLLWASVDKRYSQMLELKAEDLAIASGEYSVTNIVYYESDTETESAKINPLADVIYNNSRCGLPTVADVRPMAGTMRLIDNNNDEIYDVVIVEEYQNMFVRNVSSDEKHLMGKYSKTIRLDSYELVKIFKDGVEIKPSEIGNNVVVSYIENRDKTSIYMYVTNDKHKGEMKALRTVRGRAVYEFEDGKYRLSNKYRDVLDDDSVYAITPTVGNEYTYYLDIAGEIAEVQDSGTNMQYALLMSAREAEPYEDADAYVRLLLMDGSKVSGIIEKKVTVDTTRITAAEFLNYGPLYENPETKEKVKVQVVKVAFSDNGNLTEIDFANDIIGDAENYPYGYDPTAFALNYRGDIKTTSHDGYILLNSLYSVKNDTAIFVQRTDLDENEPYEVKNKSFATVGSSEEIYDVAEDMTIGAIYTKGYNGKGAQGYGNETDSMLVDEIDYVFEDDQELKRISGYMGGTYSSMIEYQPGDIPDDIKHGDLVRLALLDNRVTKVQVSISAEEFANKATKVVGTGTQGSIRSEVFAPLYSVSSYGIAVLTPNTWKNTYGPILTAGRGSGITVNVTVYDVTNDEMYKSSINDVYQIYTANAKGEMSGANDVMIYLRMRYETIREIVLVRY